MAKISWVSSLSLLVLVLPTAAVAGPDHVDLFQYDATTSTVLPNGPRARMTLLPRSGHFVLHARGLPRGMEFTLIQYVNPWPERGMECLGSASATTRGDLRIRGWFGSASRTDALDETAASNEPALWLVPSSDVDCELGRSEACIQGECTPWRAWNPELSLTSFIGVDPGPSDRLTERSFGFSRRPAGINLELLRRYIDFLKPETDDDGECLADVVIHSKCMALVQVMNIQAAMCATQCKVVASAGTGGDGSACIGSCAQPQDPNLVCGDAPDCQP